MLFNYFLILILIFLSIAFFTIMERKILGLFHIRLGPNKTGFIGIFQPFSDALKLFLKNLNFLSKVNEIYWNFSPILIFFFFMMILIFLPIKMENNNIMFNMLMLSFILGLPIFPMLWSSFFSTNKFSLISSKRCISQMLSYEMGLMMILIIIIPLFLMMNLENLIITMNNKNNKLIMMLIFFILILMETSRIPFDFIEGESELVSGFNIEFSSSYFSLFFIYEYGMMLFFSLLSCLLLMKFFFFFFLVFLFILIRASFPRFRYDQMMIFTWKFMFSILLMILIYMKIF